MAYPGKPNSYYYWIAQRFIQLAYTKNFALGFYSFTIERKGNYTIIECFNGGGFISIKVAEDHITRKGNYSKHRFVNKPQLLNDANVRFAAGKIPTYYSITFKLENGYIPQTDVRCVCDIEEGKKKALKIWNYTHTQNPLTEPVEWIINEV